LWAAYVVIPSMIGLAALLTPGFDPWGTGPGRFGALSPGLAVLVFLAGVGVAILLILLLGVVIPLAGLLSLYKSFLAARTRGVESARKTTWMMLVSQLGGGVLTILIVPLMRLAAPGGPWVTLASALLFACAMLMPLAFALGVWRLRVLDLDIDALPQ
jgi:hypothetical protein